MKKLLLFFVPVVFLSFTFMEQETNRKSKVQNPAVLDLNDWIINKEDFVRMDQFNKSCKGAHCKGFKLPKKRNKAVREELRKTYIILSEQTFVGRYAEEDAVRYRKARGISANDEAGKVAGYPTFITRYEVTPRSGSGGFLFAQSREIFTDEYSICPPPNGPGCE